MRQELQRAAFDDHITAGACAIESSAIGYVDCNQAAADGCEMIDEGCPGLAAVPAGVNTFGDASPNSALFGQSVARASWVITIPAGDLVPANRDLDLNAIEDLVLKVNHKALTRQTQSIPLDVSCLGSVGAGG